MSEEYRPSYNKERFVPDFVEALVGALGRSETDVASIQQQIEDRTRLLVETHQHMIVDDQSRVHLKMTSMVLAAYRLMLGEGVERKTLLAALTVAFKAPFRGGFGAGFRQWLDSTDDVWSAMAGAGTDEAMRARYGATFQFEKEVNADQTFVASNISRCFYHQFFVANGAPELTPVFCDWDRLWTDEIDPSRHGLRFERPTTMGYGGDICRFQFYKVDKARSQSDS